MSSVKISEGRGGLISGLRTKDDLTKFSLLWVPDFENPIITDQDNQISPLRSTGVGTEGAENASTGLTKTVVHDVKVIVDSIKRLLHTTEY